MDIATFHRKMEEFSTNWVAEFRAAGKWVFCQKGCAGCCNLAVHATFAEGRYVAEGLSAELETRLNRYIKGLQEAAYGLKDLKDYLKTHRQQIGPCPFLDEHGGCSIYSRRPLSCRALLSTRPADWCTVDFSTLNEWDKRAYESSLDKAVVTWPTHFVAATQDYAQAFETKILEQMYHLYGWTLVGNFPLMAWLARQYQEDLSPHSADELQSILAEHGLNSELLTTFNSHVPTER